MSVSPKTAAIYSVIFAAGLAIGSAIGFFGLHHGSVAEKPETATSPIVAIDHSRKPIKLPQGVEYRILNDKDEVNVFTQKRFVEVYLNQRVTMPVLESIADEILAKAERSYQRTLIWYYRNANTMDETRHPWAITHRNPEKEYEIRGMTIEDREWLNAVPMKTGSGVVGCWEDDLQQVKTTIYREGDGYKMDSQGAKSDPFILDFTEIAEKPNRVFRRKGYGKSADTYEVSPSGVLNVYNGDGKLVDKQPPWQTTP